MPAIYSAIIKNEVEGEIDGQLCDKASIINVNAV